MLLVGSRALPNNTLLRKLNDYDIWQFGSESKTEILKINGKTIELKTVPRGKGTTSEILELAETSDWPETSVEHLKVKIAPVWLCALLKLSHIDYVFKSKHKDDLSVFSNRKVTIPKEYVDLLSRRIQETEARVKSESFFDDNVTRIIDHDKIHTYVADSLRKGKVLYKDALLDETTISHEKFKNLSYITQLNILVDEAIVLGIEREIIPRIMKGYTPIAVWAQRARFFSKWLEKLSSDGAVAKHPLWMSQRTRSNTWSARTYLDRDTKQLQLSKEFWKQVLMGKNERK